MLANTEIQLSREELSEDLNTDKKELVTDAGSHIEKNNEANSTLQNFGIKGL